jgi:hypothetical protein
MAEMQLARRRVLRRQPERFAVVQLVRLAA